MALIFLSNLFSSKKNTFFTENLVILHLIYLDKFKFQKFNFMDNIGMG